VKLKDLPVVDVVLGIDFGSYRTGVAVIEIAEPAKLLHRVRVVAPPDVDKEKDNFVERWAMTIDHIENFMVEFLKGRPAVVALEQPNSFRNGASTRMLTGGYGAVLYWCHINDITAFDVNTAHAKKVFCGKFEKGKLPTITRANSLYGLDLKFHSNAAKSDDDVADAIQVAWALRQDLINSDDWFLERSKKPS
jgi:Holliday junction resolvasome RuvABC endonuclease subunit